MSNNLFGLVGTAERSLDYHMKRHNVLSSNVANMETPGFRPQEVVRQSAFHPGGMPVQTTAEAHISLGDASAEGQQVSEERVVESGLDGNSVSVDREMSKIAANNLRFETVSQIARQHFGLLSYAANDANRG